MKHLAIAVAVSACAIWSPSASAQAATFGDMIYKGGYGDKVCTAQHKVSIIHSGGYVAEIEVVAPVIGGVTTLALGQCAGIDSRVFAMTSRLKVSTHTGLVWDPKKLFLDVSLNNIAPPYQCVEFVISGTTLDPKVTKQIHACPFG